MLTKKGSTKIVNFMELNSISIVYSLRDQITGIQNYIYIYTYITGNGKKKIYKYGNNNKFVEGLGRTAVNSFDSYFQKF